jgi:hypothetical protein
MYTSGSPGLGQAAFESTLSTIKQGDNLTPAVLFRFIIQAVLLDQTILAPRPNLDHHVNQLPLVTWRARSKTVVMFFSHQAHQQGYLVLPLALNPLAWPLKMEA